jgi:hypothetical protein
VKRPFSQRMSQEPAQASIVERVPDAGSCSRLGERALSASFHLQTTSQSFPRWFPPFGHVRPCHFLLESLLQARVGRPRRGGFTCHGMLAQVVSPTMGNQPASACRARADPAPTHNQSGFQPFPVLCPGASRCRPTRLGYACCGPTGRAAHTGPSPSPPCTCRRFSGKMQGGTAGRGERESADGRCKGASRIEEASHPFAGPSACSRDCAPRREGQMATDRASGQVLPSIGTKEERLLPGRIALSIGTVKLVAVHAASGYEE